MVFGFGVDGRAAAGICETNVVGVFVGGCVIATRAESLTLVGTTKESAAVAPVRTASTTALSLFAEMAGLVFMAVPVRRIRQPGFRTAEAEAFRC